MPNWLTHLKVAHSVLPYLKFPVNEEKYYIGTIATDCGEVCFDENGKKYYVPPRYVTHWTDDIPDWDAVIHFDSFFDLYIRNETDYEKLSFYFGYYIHLITDSIWIELVSRPVIDSFQTPDDYRKIARNAFRDDWYRVEMQFLRSNPNFYPFNVLESIKDFNINYLKYLSLDTVIKNIHQLRSFYSVSADNDIIRFTYFMYDDYQKAMTIIEKMVKVILLSKS